MLNRRLASRRGLGRRGSVAVEFALTATFFLLPLFAGGADFIEMISAQAQLNTTLQSLYLFAYTNPALASSNSAASAVVSKINAQATHLAAFPTTTTSGGTNGALTYKCMNAAGVTQAFNTSCAAGYTKQTFVTYQVTCSIVLPAPLPFGFTNPFALAASGSVQVQ